MKAINSNFAKIEKTERLKWLPWKRNNPIYYSRENIPFPINPTELCDVYCWLALNHERYFIWRVILEPYDLDEKKETFILKKQLNIKTLMKKLTENTLVGISL